MWAASPARNTRPCQYCDTCPWWISKHVSQWLRVMLGAWADDEIRRMALAERVGGAGSQGRGILRDVVVTDHCPQAREKVIGKNHR